MPFLQACLCELSPHPMLCSCWPENECSIKKPKNITSLSIEIIGAGLLTINDLQSLQEYVRATQAQAKLTHAVDGIGTHVIEIVHSLALKHRE